MLDGTPRTDGQRYLVGRIPALRGVAHPDVAVFGGERQQWQWRWPAFDS